MISIYSKAINRIRGVIFCLKTRNKIYLNPKIYGKYYLRGKPKIFIGRNVAIYPTVIFWGTGNIAIGDNSAIGDNTIIFSS